MITPSVPNNDDIILGDGIIYKNYGLGSQRELGACSGDSKFVVTKKIVHIDYNGMYGDTLDKKRVTSCVPSLNINLLSVSPTNLADCYAGLAVTDAGTYYEVTDTLTIGASNYWTNLTFIGESKSGKDIWIQMDNVLGDSEKIEWALKTDSHVISDVQFTGHYGTTTPTTAPYRIRYYKA